MLLLVVTNAALPRSEAWHASLSTAFELACAAPPRRRIAEVHDEHACILCMLCKCCIVRMLLWGLLASFTVMQGQLKTLRWARIDAILSMCDCSPSVRERGAC